MNWLKAGGTTADVSSMGRVMSISSVLNRVSSGSTQKSDALTTETVRVLATGFKPKLEATDHLANAEEAFAPTTDPAEIGKRVDDPVNDADPKVIAERDAELAGLQRAMRGADTLTGIPRR